MHKSSLLRLIWFAVGGVSLLLGFIGILLPVMPTAPFVILAAYAFARSSPTLHRRLVEHRIFGPIILDWQKYGAIAPRIKLLAVAMMAVSLVAGYLLPLPTPAFVAQAVCMAAAAAFILSRPGGAR
ncbi:YbaN family protein [Pseudorhodobacter sp.]|uniref:YbaN family protein n=1 Tax=Pseudorhodobacter sp. TaxID=1934400 RepID=UPI002647B8FA|nr:YbaN family protein [Pseudorhodobacter sp.]MDN5787025.1 YbaN family protein [Pseudorhodobacter sp.]